MKNITIKVLLFFCFISCNSQQTFSVNKVPNSIANKYVKFHSMPSYKGEIIYIEKKLPQNYDKTGKKDYTAIIQKTINENPFVVLPNFPLLINKDGLLIPSDRIIYFQKKSKIIYAGPALTRESDVLKIYKTKNSKIYNPTIVGSRYSKEKQSGEWSAGIAIYEAENIEIYNVNISQTFGDGIIVGDQSKNVTIDGGWIDLARREGVSIISGINLKIKNLTISNTHGTLPMCGIQIEPNFPTDYFINIDIRNITGYNNKNTTLNFNIDPLAQEELKVKDRQVTFTADNIEDYLSNYTISFVMNAENKKHTPTGSIKVTNVKSHSSNNFLWQDSGKTNVKIETQQFKDSNGKTVKVK